MPTPNMPNKGYELHRAVVQSADPVTGITQVKIPDLLGKQVVDVHWAGLEQVGGVFKTPNVGDMSLVAVSNDGTQIMWVLSADHSALWGDLAALGGIAPLTTQGDLLVADSSTTTTRLGLGTAGLPLVAGATMPAYAALDINGLATAVVNRLVPAGVIEATVGATADPGYLLLDGSPVSNANTLYPALWARVPSAWKNVDGTTLNLPDARGRMLVMDDSGATLTLGALAGSTSLTIASANLPLHTHAIDHDHGSINSGSEASHTHGPGTLSTGTESANHQHAITISDPSHTHEIHRNAGTGSNTGGGYPYPLYNSGTIGTYTQYAYTGITASAGNQNANHTHTVTTGSTAAGSSHLHTVDLPNYTGSSGNGGFANTALTIPTPLSLVCNWQIKAH